jgi:hypothetical protein
MTSCALGPHLCRNGLWTSRPQRCPTVNGPHLARRLFVGKVFTTAVPRPSAPTGAVVAGMYGRGEGFLPRAPCLLGIPINQRSCSKKLLRAGLERGTLVEAAAGNNARARAISAIVEPPRKYDAAMAVAALTASCRSPWFTAAQQPTHGYRRDCQYLRSRRFSVFSSVSGVKRYATHSSNGTSRRPQHVAESSPRSWPGLPERSGMAPFGTDCSDRAPSESSLH